jgi:hypothetical protein
VEVVEEAAVAVADQDLARVVRQEEDSCMERSVATEEIGQLFSWTIAMPAVLTHSINAVI